MQLAAQSVEQSYQLSQKMAMALDEGPSQPKFLKLLDLKNKNLGWSRELLRMHTIPWITRTWLLSISAKGKKMSFKSQQHFILWVDGWHVPRSHHIRRHSLLIFSYLKFTFDQAITFIQVPQKWNPLLDRYDPAMLNHAKVQPTVAPVLLSSRIYSRSNSLWSVANLEA